MVNLPPPSRGAEERRRAGCPHVTISTELASHVGKPGVAAVEAGRTPDGEVYEWSKAGRAGKVRRGGANGFAREREVGKAGQHRVQHAVGRHAPELGDHAPAR